jgi:outer membrane protein
LHDLEARGILRDRLLIVEVLPQPPQDWGYVQKLRKDAVDVKIRAGFLTVATIGAMMAILAVLAPVGAQETAARPTTDQYKIGVVNVKEVFDQYERQKQEYEKLRSERDTKQKNIDVLADQIETKKKAFDEQKATMSEEQRTAAGLEIDGLVRQYEADFRKLQGDIDSLEKQLLERVFKDIQDAIAEVATTGNYHLVLESGEGSRTGVLFSSPTLDITQKVVDHLHGKTAAAS